MATGDEAIDLVEIIPTAIALYEDHVTIRVEGPVVRVPPVKPVPSVDDVA